jgi:hypothetical protein
MFQLDDNFLKDLGLDGLPEEQRKAFLQHTYEELELRVGTKLSEGLNGDQMQEFESFIDQDPDKVPQWLEKNIPNYETQEDYKRLLSVAPKETAPIVIMSEYGSLKWLEVNRPDYRSVVASELEKLKKEITDNREAILGSNKA